MSKSNVPGGIPPIDGLEAWAPTSKPYNARTIGDLGPGRVTGGSQGAGNQVLAQAMESPAPNVQALGALGNTARTRNCKALVAQFNAPGALGPTGLFAYRQQVLPANLDRKILLIGNPWSHGDPAKSLPTTIIPGDGGVGFAILFNQGPAQLEKIANLATLNTYLVGAYVPIGNNCYVQTQFELPPTDPVTLICWQNVTNAETSVLDVNCNVIEGT